MSRRGPKLQSGHRCQRAANFTRSGDGRQTFELGRQDRLEVGGVDSAIRRSEKEDLLQGPPSLAEVEEKELHEPRFRTGAEDLFQAINAHRALVLQQRWRKAAMLPRNGIVKLDEQLGQKPPEIPDWMRLNACLLPPPRAEVAL